MTAEIQLRTEEGALLYMETLKEAFEYANKYDVVWKISFDFSPEERVRLVKRLMKTSDDDTYRPVWLYEPIDFKSQEVVADLGKR